MKDKSECEIEDLMDFNQKIIKENGFTKEQVKKMVEKECANRSTDAREEYSERPCTVKESIEQSLKEAKLIKEGKLPKRSWRDFMKELEKEDDCKNTYVEADTERVKQAIDKCTKKHEKLLRKLGSE